MGGANRLDGRQQLKKTNAARLRRTRSGKGGGVQTIQINGEIDGRFPLSQGRNGFFQSVKGKEMQICVFFGKLELIPFSAADAKLVDTSISQQFMTAPQDAGMGQLCPQIVIPQIGVGIEMDDVEVRILLHHRPHRPQCDQMLATQQQRKFPVPQYTGGTVFNIRQCRLRAAEA